MTEQELAEAKNGIKQLRTMFRAVEYLDAVVKVVDASEQSIFETQQKEHVLKKEVSDLEQRSQELRQWLINTKKQLNEDLEIEKAAKKELLRRELADLTTQLEGIRREIHTANARHQEALLVSQQSIEKAQQEALKRGETITAEVKRFQDGAISEIEEWKRRVEDAEEEAKVKLSALKDEREASEKSRDQANQELLAVRSQLESLVKVIAVKMG